MKKLYCSNQDCDILEWDFGGCSPHGKECPECSTPGMALGLLPQSQVLVVCFTELMNVIQDESLKLREAIRNMGV